MTNMPPMPTFRTPGLRMLLASVAAVLAVAAPATALLGLPVALPAADQHIDTPLGSIDASASEQGADACYDLGTPALPVPALPAAPALPSLPVPVPVAVPAVPAIPTPSAASSACVSAGLDGASADIGADAAGIHAGTGIQADSPVPMDQVESTVYDAQSTAGATAGEATGFFEGLAEMLFGWL
jgi:hypothetical protein